MKKKVLYTLACCLLATVASMAQTPAKYGKISYSALLRSMPEYALAQAKMDTLRINFEAEAAYNEEAFNRQFAEFLQGQKEFPQSIMLKRQRDLQNSMERSIAFRHEADSLLNEARKELEHSLRIRLDSAIWAVGLERGYEFIIDTDHPVLPFVNPLLTEDANLFVRQRLEGIKPEQAQPTEETVQ